MRFARISSCSSLLALSIGGCVGVPELPNETMFPVEEILHGAVCDLQEGFTAVANNKKFMAAKWLASIKLAPKTDTDLSGSIGGTRKSSSLPNRTRLITWTFGTPGLQADVKGTNNADVTYEVKSESLIVTKGDPNLCLSRGRHERELRNHLGAANWLRRTASAMTNRASVFDMHAATYTVDIVVRFTGNGGYSYLFPGGTDVAAVSGWHEIDKNLNISIAPLTVTPPKPIVICPTTESSRGWDQSVQPIRRPPTMMLRLHVRARRMI